MKMPRRFRRDRHPIERLGTSEDVARAALFLPSMFARVSSRPCRKSLMSETSHPQRGLHLRRSFGKNAKRTPSSCTFLLRRGERRPCQQGRALAKLSEHDCGERGHAGQRIRRSAPIVLSSSCENATDTS